MLCAHDWHFVEGPIETALFLPSGLVSLLDVRHLFYYGTSLSTWYKFLVQINIYALTRLLLRRDERRGKSIYLLSFGKAKHDECSGMRLIRSKTAVNIA